LWAAKPVDTELSHKKTVNAVVHLMLNTTIKPKHKTAV